MRRLMYFVSLAALACALHNGRTVQAAYMFTFDSGVEGWFNEPQEQISVEWLANGPFSDGALSAGFGPRTNVALENYPMPSGWDSSPGAYSKITFLIDMTGVYGYGGFNLPDPIPVEQVSFRVKEANQEGLYVAGYGNLGVVQSLGASQYSIELVPVTASFLSRGPYGERDVVGLNLDVFFPGPSSGHLYIDSIETFAGDGTVNNPGGNNNPVPAPSSLACLLGVGVMVGGMEWWKKRRRRVRVTA